MKHLDPETLRRLCDNDPFTDEPIRVHTPWGPLACIFAAILGFAVVLAVGAVVLP